jgi:hypothetical protein
MKPNPINEVKFVSEDLRPEFRNRRPKKPKKAGIRKRLAGYVE